MQISPKAGMIFNGVMVAVGAIAAAGPKIFPSYVPDTTASSIVETAGFVIIIYGAVQTWMHGASSSQPGPFAPQDPPIVKAVADGASPKTVLAIAQSTVNASPAPTAPTEPNAPLQPKG